METVVTENEIREVVRQALSNVAPEVELGTVDPTKDLRDQLDVDSVDFLNFVIGLHRALAIEIPDADLPKLVTLNSCVSYLLARMSKS